MNSAMPARSRLAVILHADIVGSTALVQADERLAHERIRDAFAHFSEIIGHYGGDTHEIRGDAIVAEFNRPSDAVSAALAFQAENHARSHTLPDAIRPEARVGIALGEVVVADRTVTGAGVVLAQRLEQLAEPGGVVLQGAVQEAIPRRLPFDYASLGEQQLKGFDEPVRPYAVSLRPGEVVSAPEPAGEPAPGHRVNRARWILATLIGSVIIVSGVALLWSQLKRVEREPMAVPTAATASKARVSIAVLPFANMSGESEQEYFSDGISEDIITDLSRISELSVIARNSSFSFKQSALTTQDMAAELGATHVLDGSVRKVGDRVRISTQLIDASSNRTLWAERYDRLLVDIFDLQDEIRGKIVSALSIHLIGEEANSPSRRATSSFEAYDLFLRGRRLFNEYTLTGVSQAIGLYRQAIELDPDFARAYGALGVALCRQTQLDLSRTDREKQLEEAVALARKAVTLEPTSPQVQWALGFVQMFRGRFEVAAKAVEEAVSLAPNYADGWGLLALINNQLGRGDQALRFTRKGMALNPRYSWDYPYNEGRALYNMGEYGQAIEPLQAALERNENAWVPRLYLAASYVRVGRLEDAQWEVAELEVHNPGISLSGLERMMPMADGEHRARFFDDLRKAGLRE